jgi:hypothetical protein
MDKGAKEPLTTCPPPPYFRDFAVSLAEAAAPAVCAACWRKLLAAGWTTKASVTTKPSSGSTTSMLPHSKGALPVPSKEFPKPLHCRLNGGRNPSTMSDVAPSFKEQVVVVVEMMMMLLLMLIITIITAI